MGNRSSEGKQETVFFDEDGGSWVPWDIVQGMIDSALARAKASGVAIPESMGSLVVVEVNGQEAVCLHDVVQFFASAPSCVWENLPDDWKSEFLTPDIWPPPVCRASEQREAVARYLTTAPEIPRIVRRFHTGFGTPPEEKLPPNWGPDDLIRWICEKTDWNIGKGYLTAEGYQRARELYEPKDPIPALFRTAPRLHTGGGALVGRGFHPLSLAELLRVQPDTRDWPALSPAQRNMCANYIRPWKVAEGQTYSDPHPEELWARYQVHTGVLPHDFNLVALMRLVLDAGGGRVELNPDPPEVDFAPVSDARVYDAMKYLKITDANPRFRLMLLVAKGTLSQDFTTAELLTFWRSRGGEWTKEGYDWASENGLLNEGHPVASGTVKAQGRLAADVGAESWGELEFRVLANELAFRKAGTNGPFIHKKWEKLGMESRLLSYALLIQIAKFRGTFPKDHDGDKRRRTVHALNKALKAAFGLPGNPFRNDRRLGTQTAIGAISWGGKS